MDDILKEIEKAADDIQIPTSLDPNNVKKKLKKSEVVNQDVYQKIKHLLMINVFVVEVKPNIMQFGESNIKRPLVITKDLFTYY